jgi:hypothetical protein
VSEVVWVRPLPPEHRSAEQAIADMREAIAKLPRIPPRIEHVYVRNGTDLDFLTDKCGALLDHLRVSLCPYLADNSGCMVLSDGSVRTFKLRGADE